MTGKDLRLSRLLGSSHRLLIVPMDHGITIGPVQGLSNIQETVRQVAEGGANGVIVHKGLVKELGESLKNSDCQLIVHLSASTSLSPDADRKMLVSSVEHAIRLGATGVSVHVNLGSAYESAMLKDLGEVAERCDLWGVPLLAMMYVRDGFRENEFKPEKIKHAARVAEEIGADLIKVNYTGDMESFKEVTASVKVPVLIAGGPKSNSTFELLKMIHNAMAAGAAGISIGRNIFQATNPTLLVKTIRQIVDGKASEELLESLAKEYEKASLS